MSREEELARQGWVKQTTYDEPRLSEMIELYRELGYEVLVEPFDPESEIECAECMKIFPERYKTIYTRMPDGEDDSPPEAAAPDADGADAEGP
jgi:hypothetical protein